MTENKIIVGIGEYKVASNNEVLVTMSLGSCVGVALYDPVSKVGGLAHIMLPNSAMSKSHTNLAKFADTGIRMMLEDMLKMGANKVITVAKIVGGACMFESKMADPMMKIGERNVEAVREILTQEGIPIFKEDTGKNYGRTVEFYTETGKVIVKSYQKPTIEL